MPREVIRVAIGEVYPEEYVVKQFKGTEGGASLNYNAEDKTLSLFVGIPNPRTREAKAVQSGLIRFALCPNKELDTSVLMVYFGADLVFDLVYDINVLPHEIDGLVEGNRFGIYLLDSNTGIVKALRVLGVGPKFLREINTITRNDQRYTTEQYQNWLNKVVYQKSLSQLWQQSNRIDWDA